MGKCKSIRNQPRAVSACSFREWHCRIRGRMHDDFARVAIDKPGFELDANELRANEINQHLEWIRGRSINANLVYFSGSFVRTDFPFSGRVVRGDASQPSGSQWTSIASTNVQGTGTAPHTDSRALAFTAGSRLIEGDDGGIYELPVANVGSEGMIVGGVGSEWRSLNGNLADSEMHSMAYDPVSRIFFGGAQDTGFQNQLTPGLALRPSVLDGRKLSMAMEALPRSSPS